MKVLDRAMSRRAKLSPRRALRSTKDIMTALALPFSRQPGGILMRTLAETAAHS
jgi:hypothetical protein